MKEQKWSEYTALLPPKCLLTSLNIWLTGFLIGTGVYMFNNLAGTSMNFSDFLMNLSKLQALTTSCIKELFRCGN